MKIPDFRFGTIPSRVRLTVRVPAYLIPGQRVRVRAGLLPPPQPATPGGYDFQRIAWFEGIGAVGYAVSVPELVEGETSAGWPSAEPLRQVIGERLRKGLSGDGGAVAAALVTGERYAISPAMTNAYRDAGLSHLLAISGLNIGIYAGIVFVVVRGGFAFVPAVALRWDVKKLAALLALLATTFYLLVSGSNVPAVRSWLMGGVVLLSIVLDRKAISFRVLGIAAFFILLWQPESILGPSFQMSFAAVLSLVSGYMIFHPYLAGWRASATGPVSAAWRAGAIYMFGIIASTLLATVATAPYAIYHFHRLPLYGLFANLVAVPVTSIWVMPWLILALALMPFGMEHVALVPLGWGLDIIGDLAVFIADLPHASLHTPPMSVLALVVATLSGLWFCIWQGRWRWWSFPFLVVALLSPWIWPDTPHLLVSGNGKLAAVHDGTGLVLSPGRSDGFTRSMWLERWGEGLEQWDRWSAGDGPLRCDLYGCLYRQNGHVISLAHREEAIVEDCGQVDILVPHHKVSSSSFLRRGCKGTHFIDGRTLAREGSHVIYFDKKEIRITTVSAWQGRRLWSHRDIQGKKKEDAESAKALPTER